MSTLKPKLALTGSRSNRTPLAYPVYKDLFEDHFDYAAPEHADLLVFAMPFEISGFFEFHPELLSHLTPASVWLVSEEPLWDTVWNREHLRDASYSLSVNGATVQVNQLSHFANSPYKGLELPYFLTTTDDYVCRYQHYMSAQLKDPAPPRKLGRGLGLLEFRFDPANDVLDSTGELIGLSNYRTRLMQYLRAHARFRAAGHGWSGERLFGEVHRKDAEDFHLQKLEVLKGGYDFLFALENTLQQHYVTEKFFDALAVGSVPLYYADPAHDIFKFVDPCCFINIYGKGLGPALIDDIECLNARRTTQMVRAGLSACLPLFSDRDALARTRHLVVERISAELLARLQ